MIFIYNGIDAFNWSVFSSSFFSTVKSKTLCAWFPFIMKGQTWWDKFMNYKQKILGFHFFFVFTLIIRFTKITDKVYQLIWILTINWKNSVLFLKSFVLKIYFSYKNSLFQVAYGWHKLLGLLENWWVSVIFIK